MKALIFVALLVAFFTWCFCAAAKNADEDCERLWREINGGNDEEK